MFIPEDLDDLKAFLTPQQWEQLQAKLKERGKVLVRGVPIIPEVSEARTQGDWSCRRMSAKKYGRKKPRRRP